MNKWCRWCGKTHNGQHSSWCPRLASTPSARFHLLTGLIATTIAAMGGAEGAIALGVGAAVAYASMMFADTIRRKFEDDDKPDWKFECGDRIESYVGDEKVVRGRVYDVDEDNYFYVYRSEDQEYWLQSKGFGEYDHELVGSDSGDDEDPLTDVREAYITGEIDEDEFEARLDDLLADEEHEAAGERVMER